MRNTRVLSFSGASIALLALAACHHQPEARHEPGAKGDGEHGEHDGHSDEHRRPELGSGISTHLAVDKIAKARCEREERCENVGEGKKFVSMAVCDDKIRADWSDDLNKYECPKGIVHAELDECLNDVRAEDCNSPFDTLSRIMQCSASDICDD